MAFRSRYSQAFSRIVQSPEITVQPFAPGSVTKPAAILKGISMYAKARSDERNRRAAENAMSAQSVYSGPPDSRVTYTSPDGKSYLVTPYEQANLDYRDRKDARPKPVAPSKGLRLDPAMAKALHLTPGDDGLYDPEDTRAAFQWYRQTRPRPSSRGGGPTRSEVQAEAHQRYMSTDAPLVDRHARILLNQDASGSPVMVGGKQSAYSEEARSAAAAHLGIDYEAWALHDPSRFPVTSKTDAMGNVTPDVNRDARKAAAAWQQQTLQQAVGRFRTERIRQYADNALPDAPAAGEQAQPDHDAFEQQFLNALGAGGQ